MSYKELIEYIYSLNNNIYKVLYINKELPYLPKGFYYSKFYGGIPSYLIFLRTTNNYYNGYITVNDNNYKNLNLKIDYSLYNGTVLFGYLKDDFFYIYDPLIVCGNKYINYNIIDIYNKTHKILDTIPNSHYVNIYETQCFNFQTNIMLRMQTYNADITKFIIKKIKLQQENYYVLNKIYTFKIKKSELPDVYNIYDLEDNPINKILYIKNITESQKIKEIFKDKNEIIAKVKIININNDIKFHLIFSKNIEK